MEKSSSIISEFLSNRRNKEIKREKVSSCGYGILPAENMTAMVMTIARGEEDDRRRRRRRSESGRSDGVAWFRRRGFGNLSLGQEC
ncbi:hypothetical protein L484_018345 [Morus notabilis]|uniref:Uncharacterized protein n=1 Tax=Morus notabilis TaxID=981085 RepID=W9R2E7_9ROSA|nr:hypothetical protein L484_018345 [Morus notabilis]